MTKSVSVVMATLNSGPILERALKSVRNQIYDQRKIEIVVADGGSTDGTLKIIKKFGGRVISEKTGGPESAKAVALRHAKNEIVLEIDCDNIFRATGSDAADGPPNVSPGAGTESEGDGPHSSGPGIKDQGRVQRDGRG